MAASEIETPLASAPTGTAGRRVRLVTFDQALSSASNLLIVILVAHVLDPIDFGRFGVVMLIYTFALAPTRAVISVPALVHPEDADQRAWSVLGSALVLSVAGGIVCAAIGGVLTATGSLMGPATLVLGAVLPFLQLQDVARYMAIARSNPMGAVILDGVWLVLMIGSFFVAKALGFNNLIALIIVWGGSGTVASFWIIAQYGFPHRGDVTLGWLRERWDFSWRSLVSNMSSTGGALLGASLISAVSSPIAVAAVRASLLMGRPSASVQAAVSSSVAADIARDAPDDAGLRRQQRRAMLISFIVALVNLGVLVALPDWFGEKVLGKTWYVISPLMFAVGMTVVAMAAQSGVRAALLGRRQIQVTMIADVAGAVALIISLVIGAALADAKGAVWGLVAGQLLTALCWWIAFTGYLRAQRSGAKHRIAD